jgi:glycerate-2-kinase
VTNADLSRHAESIFRAALAAVAPAALMGRILRVEGDRLHVGENSTRLGPGRVLVAGGGKASGAMAAALEGILGDRIDSGARFPRAGCAFARRATRPRRAACRRPEEMLAARGAREISSSSSSRGRLRALTLPAEACPSRQAPVTDHLLRAGAAIGDPNAVRKPRASSGRLARPSRPGGCSRSSSDVVGDRST